MYTYVFFLVNCELNNLFKVIIKINFKLNFSLNLSMIYDRKGVQNAGNWDLTPD